MKRYCATITVLIVALAGICNQPTGAPPEIHCKHFIHGYPLGAPATNDTIIRECYALSSNVIVRRIALPAL